MRLRYQYSGLEASKVMPRCILLPLTFAKEFLVAN